MEVVLVRGCLGMRIRSDDRTLPDPMTLIGGRSVPWHIMRRGPSTNDQRVHVIDLPSPATVH